MEVLKFGGRSIDSAEGIKQCGSIVESHGQGNLVVISAISNTTALLKKATPSSWEEVKNRHRRLTRDLGLEKELLADIYQEGDSLLAQGSLSSPGKMDQWYALGEKCSSKIFATYLARCLKREVLLFDADEVIKTDRRFGQATPLLSEITLRATELLIPPLNRGISIVTQGFIGSTLEGETTTLGFDGSDYSATLLAEATRATVVKIWSDVPGIFSADPRLVNAAHPIAELSFPLAKALIDAGCKMLFPRSIEPVCRSNIKLFVGSSDSSESGGTWISSSSVVKPGPLALSLRDSTISLIGTEIEKIIIDLPEVARHTYRRDFAVKKEEGIKRLNQCHRTIFNF